MNRWQRACKQPRISHRNFALEGSALPLGHEVLQRIFPFLRFLKSVSRERWRWGGTLIFGWGPETVEPDQASEVIGNNRDSIQQLIAARGMRQNSQQDG